MSALFAVALTRLHECVRRPLPWVVAGTLALLTLASRALLGFTFGAEGRAIADLVISAAFLAGLAHAVLLATSLIDRDLERGTLALALTKPLSHATYVLGSYLGVTLSAVMLYMVVLALGGGLILLLPASGGAPPLPAVLAAAGRGLLALMVLHAAALLASTALPRAAAAPVLLLAFVAASVAPGTLLPDPALYAVETVPPASPSGTRLVLYTVAHGTALLAGCAFVLTLRTPLRGRS